MILVLFLFWGSAGRAEPFKFWHCFGGRYLNERGYTCHAPQYKGHGVPPEELVHTGPEDWWKDVMDGYEYLRSEGYENIAACGLSLGGVFSLKLGYTVPIKGIVPMCAPMHIKSEEVMYEGVLSYARNYKKFEGKQPEQIEKEMKEFEKNLNGKVSVHYSKIKYNCAIFVTKEELPLYDLLIKNQIGAIKM